jgi:hypothetical protein
MTYIHLHVREKNIFFLIVKKNLKENLLKMHMRFSHANEHMSFL